jgi:hypothetical protein
MIGALKTTWLSTGVNMATLVVAVAIGIATPAFGQRSAASMLDQLESGRWELRSSGNRGQSEQICLRDGRRLIQLRHPLANCERMIVAEDRDEVTVQYTCRGRGYGRTHIRLETGRLVQIDSQGIVDGSPFDFTAEGRRVGDCPG